MRRSKAKAAPSQLSACSMACSGEISQGWVEQIQVGQLASHQGGVGQSGERVFRGVPGDGQGRRDRFANGLLTTAGGTRRALALPHVQGDAEALVTVEFDGFHLALTHRGGQPLLHGDRHFAGTGALPARLLDDALDLLA